MDALAGYTAGFLVFLLCTCFVKVFTTFTVLRIGLGLCGGSFGLVTFAISLALSSLIMGPQLDAVGGLDALIRGRVADSAEQFRPFLEKHTDPMLRDRLARLTATGAAASQVNKKSAVSATGSGPPAAASAAPAPGTTAAVSGAADTATSADPVATVRPGLALLSSAFLLGELQAAFELGFLILIPFLVIDLIVANVLVLIGVTEMSQHLVAVPLKILLFFAVDGWMLISEKLVRSYL